ncbi:hypothetical protein OHA41_00880 [Streptomyces sp. NBC_00342]
MALHSYLTVFGLVFGGFDFTLHGDGREPVDKTTSRLRNETGRTWCRYAAGNDPRLPAG